MAVMEKEGIETRGIVTYEEFQTTVKTRVMTGRQQIVRVDWDRPLELGGQILADVLARARGLAAEATGIIIEDYGKGVITQEIVSAVLEVASERKIPVGFDPKANHWLRVYGITVATPNLKEAFLAAGIPEHPISGDPVKDVVLRKVAGILLQKWKPKLLVITLGPHGMLLLGENEPPCAIPTQAREVYDVSGAGDTVIAMCVLAIAAGASHYEAAELANYAAGVVVGKLGTASCSREELLDCVE
jgi:D-beta-D-heptose 7-phosphate kinase/D-beta-D-heptose 1-phosphate adenosyltransferase